MKIKIMTQDALDYMKKNLKNHLQQYRNKENPEVWLSKAIRKPAFVDIDSTILTLEDIKLKFSKTTSTEDEVNNIKNFYLAFKDLNCSFATDERLWAGLSHTTFRDYLFERWPLDDLDDENCEKSIMNHWFFKLSNQRVYMMNTLARYWWIGYKLYQEGVDNPFYILDFVSGDINGMLFELLGSNYANNPRLLKLFMDSLIKFESQTGIKINRDNLNETKRHINFIGGKQILDLLEPSTFENNIISFLSAKYNI